MFTDCQAAIVSVFKNGVPSSKVSLTMQIKEMLARVEERGLEVMVHWVPGHMGIKGNEHADKLAKEAANESLEMDDDFVGSIDGNEMIQVIKKKSVEKCNWKLNNKFELSRGQEVFDEVGRRNLRGDICRDNFAALNQLISGQTKLNGHLAHFVDNISPQCDLCGIYEDTHHYLFQCDKYQVQRKDLELEVELAIKDEESTVSVIDEHLLLGQKGLSKDARVEVTQALLRYIAGTSRFC